MKRAVIAAALLLSVSAAAEPKIAVTFDDLPVHGTLPDGMTRLQIAQQVIDALKAAGIPPTYGFVNASLIDKEPAAAPVLSLWRGGGNLLGNHTFAHPGLSQIATADYETEIVRNEPVIAAAAETSEWHWFRYPFLDEGKDAVQRAEIRGFLAGRGYRIATVGTGLNDWDYPAPYARCLAKNDTAAIAKLEAMYLKRAEDGLAYSRALATAAYGRDVPYVLLLHIGSFQAHMLPRLLAQYQAGGVTFVSLDEAAADPLTRAHFDPALPAPPSMEKAVADRGLPVPPQPSAQADVLDAMCR
jgi:peptidoglycan/xylan/chitin deacetylase (PgdA/CDA1 family)